jgi:hypothetical protein
MEEEKGEWFSTILPLYLCICLSLLEIYAYRGFKALKQAAKITFRLKRFEDSFKYYSRLLTYIKKAVTRKYVLF